MGLEKLQLPGLGQRKVAVVRRDLVRGSGALVGLAGGTSGFAADGSGGGTSLVRFFRGGGSSPR